MFSDQDKAFVKQFLAQDYAQNWLNEARNSRPEILNKESKNIEQTALNAALAEGWEKALNFLLEIVYDKKNLSIKRENIDLSKD